MTYKMDGLRESPAPPANPLPAEPEPTPRIEAPRDDVLDSIDRETGAEPTRNVVDVFGEGPEAFQMIEQEIDKAERSIDINVFSWANDSTGTRIASRLVERAQEGVRVRVKVDLLGSLFVGCKKELPGYMFRNSLSLIREFAAVPNAINLMNNPDELHNLPQDQQKTLQERLFSIVTDNVLLELNGPLRSLNNVPNITLQIQRQPLSSMDHTKIFLFDDTTVYSGGMNVGDDYSGGHHPEEGFDGSERPTYWRDYMVRMTGPATTIHRNTFFEGEENVPSSENQPGNAVDVRVLHNRAGPAREGESRAREKQITFTVETLLQNAEQEILIEHAYIMDDTVVHLLNAAASRGVTVRIIRSRPEALTIERINNRYFQQLQPSPNMHIYLADSVLHTKLLCVDGRYTLVGSANLNRESLNYHRESAMLFGGNSAHRRLYEPLLKRFEEMDMKRSMDDYLRAEVGDGAPPASTRN